MQQCKLKTWKWEAMENVKWPNWYAKTLKLHQISATEICYDFDSLNHLSLIISLQWLVFVSVQCRLSWWYIDWGQREKGGADGYHEDVGRFDLKEKNFKTRKEKGIVCPEEGWVGGGCIVRKFILFDICYFCLVNNSQLTSGRNCYTKHWREGGEWYFKE